MPLSALPLWGWPRGAQNPGLVPYSSASMSHIRAALWAELAEKREMQKLEREAPSVMGRAPEARVCQRAAPIPHSASSRTLPIFQVEKLKPGTTKGLPKIYKPLLLCQVRKLRPREKW